MITMLKIVNIYLCIPRGIAKAELNIKRNSQVGWKKKLRDGCKQSDAIILHSVGVVDLTHLAACVFG